MEKKNLIVITYLGSDETHPSRCKWNSCF